MKKTSRAVPVNERLPKALSRESWDDIRPRALSREGWDGLGEGDIRPRG